MELKLQQYENSKKRSWKAGNQRLRRIWP